MNLKQLEAFVQVADGGSFSKAARELYLTQPTISAHISSLEKELNARLFVRNTKEVSLSVDGEKLYDYARQMIELERKIERAFGADQKKETQCISIAASTIPAQYLLPKVLARFSERYPKEQFKIMEMDSTKVTEQVVNHTIEIGFTGTVLEKKHCKYIPFYRDELIVIAPNNEKFRQLKNQNATAVWLAKEPLIMREEGSGTRKEAERQLKVSGIDTSSLNVIASIENQETIKQSVSNGMGVAIISKLATAEETQREKLIVFNLPAQDRGRDLNVVYNKNFQLSLSAEKFIKMVKEVYGISRKTIVKK
ncbi:MAG: selenium metabolism-associated LysR family transcriptional regulator [Lachnospiraceae bacterium]